MCGSESESDNAIEEKQIRQNYHEYHIIYFSYTIQVEISDGKLGDIVFSQVSWNWEKMLKGRFRGK